MGVGCCLAMSQNPKLRHCAAGEIAGPTIRTTQPAAQYYNKDLVFRLVAYSHDTDMRRSRWINRLLGSSG